MSLALPAHAKIRLLLLPYSSQRGSSLARFLIAELKSTRWSRFAAAVAFVKHSANYAELLQALTEFAKSGNVVELTFGANIFGAEASGSDYRGVETLLRALRSLGNARLFLYHEKTRIFHPKVYLFDNDKRHAALLIVGSSNWTHGGLHNNVEANIVVELDTRKRDQRRLFRELRSHFERFWQQVKR